jgi:ligand-binding sensor domain-containing protein/two-component sensor histidine kinase
MLKLRLCWLPFFLLISHCGSAQFSNIRFEKFTAANGLSDNNTNAIMQDSHGFIWIGTNHGVSRYDGRYFKKYTQLGENGLTDLSIVCLAEDEEGNIWIGTQNGLNRLNPYTEIITKYYEGSGPGTIPYKWCNYLYVDKQKRLWLTSEKGIALFDKTGNKFLNYPVNVSGKDPRTNKFITKVLEDSQGRFWLATSFGIKLFDRETKKYKSYYFHESKIPEQPAYPVMSLAESVDGTIWAGTWTRGLLKYNEQGDFFEKQTSAQVDFGKLVLSDIKKCRIQSKNYLLLATNNALIFLDAAHGFKTISVLSDDFCQIYDDKQGNIWLTSVSGLYKMNNNSLAFEWINIPVNTQGQDLIFHIIPDIKKPGALFYLSSLHGWWQYDSQIQKIRSKPLPADPENLLGGITSWYNDGKGYWFSSVNGIGYFNLYNYSLTDLSSLANEKSGQVSSGRIMRDSFDKLWITMHRSGIIVYDRLNNSVISLFNKKNMPDNLSGKDINDLKPGPDGQVYFTAGNKLFVVQEKDYSYKTYTPDIEDKRIDEAKISPENLLFTTNQRLFISSALQIYEFKNDRFITKYPVKGYSEFIIEKLYSEENGTLWIKTSKGVFKTDTTFKHWININNRLGWPDNEIITDIYTGIPGEIIFAGDRKIGILKDSLLLKSSAPPSVIISRIKHGDKEEYLVSLRSTRIKCDYKESVEIELSSIDFNNEKENKILYRLEGWDNDWKELPGQPVIRYEQLPSGDYNLITKQINAEGAESAVTSVTFSIPQPFYKTWWFFTLLALTAGFIHFTINRYKLQKALELERLRTRIATDLHDDIGATLSSISIYSEALKGQLKEDQPYLVNVLDKMGENSREMVNSMSDIVWAINPGNDNGEKLISRMENYATNLCAVKNIQLHFNEDEKVKSISFPLEQRKNIYLIFKETVNNAVKYAQAENIWVSLLLNGKKLTLTIKDDGNGFDESTIKLGNGLNNIKLRAAELKAELNLVSAENEGTTVIMKWDL